MFEGANYNERTFDTLEERRAYNQGYADAVGRIMRGFFGATSAELVAREVVQCQFQANSREGQENRPCNVHDANTPEQNLKQLWVALQQQRWYQEQRDAIPAPEFPPATWSAQPADQQVLVSAELEMETIRST